MILVTNPAYLKSIVSFLRTFRACQVILSFDSDILEIYAKDIESIHFLKAKVKIKQDRPIICSSIKVRLEDLKEVFNSIDNVTELKMDLNRLEMLEALITSPMRTIQVSILYQLVRPPALWEKKYFPFSWSMTQKAFKKSFSNQGQIERYIRITSAAGGQIQLETNKAHHVICKETLYTAVEKATVESAEFLISLDLIKKNLNLPCKKLTISCSKDVLQLSSSAITIRTMLKQL